MVMGSCGPRCRAGRGWLFAKPVAPGTGAEAKLGCEDEEDDDELCVSGLKLSATTAFGMTETMSGSKEARSTVFSLLSRLRDSG